MNARLSAGLTKQVAEHGEVTDYTGIRVLTVSDDPHEWAAIAHLRGWCHSSVACPICPQGRTTDGVTR